MNGRKCFGLTLTLSALVPATSPRLGAQVGTAQVQPPVVQADVPADLRPLLTPRRSEMRLVIARYTQDRSLLGGNYAGGGGGRGGAGAGAATSPVPVSPARISRLMRFDLSWTTAIDKIDASKLTPAARSDLDSLRATIKRNQAQSSTDATALESYTGLIPFRQSLVDVIESRLRLEDVQSEKAAGALDRAVRSIAVTREMLLKSPRPPQAQAALAANAAEILRSNIASWFGFYNNYDPLFTWWMGVPAREIDTALRGYSAFLRDSLSTGIPPLPIPPVKLAIVASAPPKFSEVPDLQEILTLPQDESIEILNRFMGRGAGGGRGGGGGAPRDASHYRAWLTALKTLDFDNLSRNAQVNYLFIKHSSEIALAREGKSLPVDPPRKADDSGIIGAARGREGLLWDLQDEMIPYSPEQLMVLAEREFAWCEAEMLKASKALGYGSDWKAALEKVKTTYVPPGGQPAMIRDLIFEAIDFLRAKDLVTVPEIAAESQRMSMMSAQAQLANPFFLGGSLIQVSYPTNEMSYDARMQSMRGNNPGFSHATAFHEMIPGHNLTGYLNARYAGYRATFPSTPFYTEGWALYWELTMYDKGFHATPEQKIGALYWRMHRCARIIFSLKFHMGLWSPQEAVDFLVDKVGHERANAKAEVVRSFAGEYGAPVQVNGQTVRPFRWNYSPLYQAGYLLGGIQIRGLRRELVDTKKMTERAFHDEILRQGNMPINLLRLGLTREKLTRDMNIDWDFYGPLPEK